MIVAPFPRRKQDGAPRSLGRDVRLFFSATVFSSLALGVFNVAFNLYVLSMGISETQLGAIVGAGPLATALVAIPVSFLSEIIGYKKSFILILAITGLTQLARVTTGSVSVMVIAAFIGGLGSAGEFVVRLPFLAQNCAGFGTTLAFSLNQLLSNISMSLGNVAAGYLPGVGPLGAMSQSIAYRSVLVFASVLTLLAVVPIAMIKNNRPKPANTVSLAPYLWGIDADTVRFAAVSLFRGLSMGFVSPFLNVYFIQHLGVSRQFFSNVMATAIIPIMIGVSFAPAVSKRLGRIRSITVIRCLSSLPLIVMALTRQPMLAAMAEWSHRGLSMMEGPLSFSFSMQVSNERNRPAIAAWLHVTFVFGNAIAAPIAGYLLACRQYNIAFYMAAAAIGVAGIINPILFRHHSEEAEEAVA